MCSVPARSRGRNLNRNLAEDAFATIRPQQSLDGDLVARTRFGHVGARTLQTSRAAIGNEIEVQLDAFDLRGLVWVLEDAAEVLAQRERDAVRCGSRAIGRRVHVLHGELGIAKHRDVAIEAIGRVLAVLVHPLNGVEDCRHHCGGRDLGVVQHFVVELLGMRNAAEGQGHRNHVWLAIEAAHDACAPILHERANRLGGVDDLEGVLRRSQRCQHRRLGHRHVDASPTATADVRRPADDCRRYR